MTALSRTGQLVSLPTFYTSTSTIYNLDYSHRVLLVGRTRLVVEASISFASPCRGGHTMSRSTSSSDSDGEWSRPEVLPEDHGDDEPWTFQFQDVSIKCEGPPWDFRDASTVKVPKFVAARSATYVTATTLLPIDPAVSARAMAWGAIKLAEQGVVPDEELFISTSIGASVTLRPEPRSLVPLQHLHISHRVLDNAAADTSCRQLDTAGLLSKLNAIMETTYTLDEPYLCSCLEHFLSCTRDFGQVYGHLRPRWKDGFSGLLQHMEERRAADEIFRLGALSQRRTSIQTSAVPPRRIWDLYSNRILPFHVLPDCRPDFIPENIWTVSHSWVAEEEIEKIATCINGFEWPVPIPRGTSLEHVRVELLNFGAEYVWLDVLCLRQHSREGDDALRKAEWKLDVPTIGHVYSDPSRICVTYFNGLGLAFDPSKDRLLSERHWLKRVWTVQEATSAFLPGGLTGAVSDETRQFFQITHPAALLDREPESEDIASLLPHALQILRRRCYSNEVDMISGLAYLLRCPTLPVYNETVPAEHAWLILTQHFLPRLRTSLAFWHMAKFPDSNMILPSWKWLRSANSFLPGVYYVEANDTRHLHVLDDFTAIDSPPSYYHTVTACGPCVVVDLNPVRYFSSSGEEPSPGRNSSHVEDSSPIENSSPIEGSSPVQDSLSAQSLLLEVQELTICKEGSPTAAGPAGCHKVSAVLEGSILPGRLYAFLKVFDSEFVWAVVEVLKREKVKGTEGLVVVKQGVLAGYLPSSLRADIPLSSVIVVYANVAL